MKAKRDALWRALDQEGVARMVVNGEAEADWGDVADLARERPQQVIPSYGLHPWRLKERSPRWREALAERLDATQGVVGIGEVGLDRWIQDYDLPDQEAVFLEQMAMAVERNLPLSVHCLRAWGRLFDLLRGRDRPKRGFLLHSYGGPREMIGPLAKLGAYFSLSGRFGLPRKSRQLETFKEVPPDRLLIETDAPDMVPPPEMIRHPLEDAEGRPLNHPGNLRAVYELAGRTLGEPVEKLAERVEENFDRLFRGEP